MDKSYFDPILTILAVPLRAQYQCFLTKTNVGDLKNDINLAEIGQYHLICDIYI